MARLRDKQGEATCSNQGRPSSRPAESLPQDECNGSVAIPAPWRRVRIPHPSFRKAPNHVAIYTAPASHKFNPGELSCTQCALLRWDQDGNEVKGRWTNESATFLADIFPVPLQHLEKAEGAKNGTSGPVWFPTLALNIDFKRLLPDRGEAVLLSQVNARCINNWRITVEVEIVDSDGRVVALATHATLIMSSARNQVML